MIALAGTAGLGVLDEAPVESSGARVNYAAQKQRALAPSCAPFRQDGFATGDSGGMGSGAVFVTEKANGRIRCGAFTQLCIHYLRGVPHPHCGVRLTERRLSQAGWFVLRC